MIAITVPIAIPIGRALGENVIMSRTDVANCLVPAAGPELRSPIATLDLHFSEPIGLDRSVVPELCKIIAGPPSERSRRKLAANNRTVAARKGVTLRKRVRAHRHARRPRKHSIAARTEACAGMHHGRRTAPGRGAPLRIATVSVAISGVS